MKTFAFDKLLFISRKTFFFPNLSSSTAGEKVYGFLRGKKKNYGFNLNVTV